MNQNDAIGLKFITTEFVKHMEYLSRTRRNKFYLLEKTEICDSLYVIVVLLKFM